MDRRTAALKGWATRLAKQQAESAKRHAEYEAQRVQEVADHQALTAKLVSFFRRPTVQQRSQLRIQAFTTFRRNLLVSAQHDSDPHINVQQLWDAYLQQELSLPADLVKGFDAFCFWKGGRGSEVQIAYANRIQELTIRYRRNLIDPRWKDRQKPDNYVDSILRALWTLNRRAKRCRDAARQCHAQGHFVDASLAKEEKNLIYEAKNQSLAYLINDNRLESVGYHRFGDNFAEIVAGEGYRFHRPCPPQVGEFDDLTVIEAKPESADELDLEVARYCVGQYLRDRPAVSVFEWKAKPTFFNHDRDDEDWDDSEID